MLMARRFVMMVAIDIVPTETGRHRDAIHSQCVWGFRGIVDVVLGGRVITEYWYFHVLSPKKDMYWA